MKKICFVTTISLTLRSFFLETAKYIHENTDWDVTFICDYDEEFAEILPDYIHYIPIPMKRGISIEGIKAMLQMKKIFQKENFDLIQYSTPNAALYASIASKLSGCKIRNYHLMGFRYLGAFGFSRTCLKCIERFTCRLSTSIECVSQSNLEFGVQENVFAREKATVVWNGSTGGVDLSKFDFTQREMWRTQVRKEIGINQNDFVFGFVGRITKDKGINELLEAFFNLKTKAKLLIVGNLENINSLDDSLWNKALNASDVKIIDARTDIERYFSAMDVLVLPSYREGFGNVIIEAGAVGTPSIVTNIPGPIDAIENGKTGVTVIKGDSSDLLKKMELAVSKGLFESPEYCSEFVKNHFDSLILNKYILKRKQQLLSEVEKI
ncbi:MAG: glycosyltransferase [Erysipelotrichia bacterium]|nr:glycosyltransferase [Erysipelotrichia bacterium]